MSTLLSAAFEHILEMNKVGMLVILLVLFARFIFKHASARLRALLWWLVIIRLLVPFSISSSLSLFNFIPETRPVPPSIPEAVSPSELRPITPPATSLAGGEMPTATAGSPSAEPQWMTLLAALWLIGCLLLLSIALYQYVQLSRRLRCARPLEPGVYESDAVKEPFLFGLFRPRIYLPAMLPEEARPYVIAHEKAHRRRGDHLFSGLAYLALCVHWFNPLVWFSLKIMSDDIERACDENAIRSFTFKEKQAYSHLILDFACRRNILKPVEVSFGASATAARIQGILQSRKRPFWLSVLFIGLMVVLAVSTITNPLHRMPTPLPPKTVEALFQEEPTSDGPSPAYLEALSNSSGIRYTERRRENDVLTLYGHFPKRTDALQRQALTLSDALMIAGRLKEPLGIAFYETDGQTPISHFTWAELSDYSGEDILSRCADKEGFQRHMEEATTLGAQAMRLTKGDTSDYPQNLKEAQLTCRFAPARVVTAPEPELFKGKADPETNTLMIRAFANLFPAEANPSIQCRVVDLVLDERSGQERQLIGIVHNVSWQLHGNTLVMVRSYSCPFAFEARLNAGQWHIYNQHLAASGAHFISSVETLCKDPKTGRLRPNIADQLIVNYVDYAHKSRIATQLDRQLYNTLEKANALPVVCYGKDRLSLLSAVQKG